MTLKVEEWYKLEDHELDTGMWNGVCMHTVGLTTHLVLPGYSNMRALAAFVLKYLNVRLL